MRNLFSNLMNKKFKVVERSKYFFISSAIVILIGILTMVLCGVFGDKTGGALNFGMDFAGGYSLNVQLGTRIESSADYNKAVKELTGVIQSVTDDEGKALNVKVSQTQKQGEKEKTSILVRYKGVVYNGEKTDKVMNDVVNPAIQKAIESKFFTEEDEYSGRVIMSGSIGATVSNELLYSAIGAVILASVLMLLYVAFRFEMSSGIAAVVTILHDIMIMISFMAFTRIPVNSAFIAAIITIMGYAINNTIIIFDRIREAKKSPDYAAKTGKEIANQAIKSSISRTINTSVTTLITITLVTIIGVPAIREFAIPIIIGLLSGVYSANCIAPSIWAIWHDRKNRKTKNSISFKVQTEKVKTKTEKAPD